MKSLKQEQLIQIQAIKSPVSSEQPLHNYKYAIIVGNALETRMLKRRPFNEKLFNSDQWDISDRKFKDQNMHETFKFISECLAKTIKIDYNKFTNIIKSISNTRFTNLTKIYLGDNTICSIEMLQTVSSPNLQELYLNDNPITQIKSLRKCNFVNLKKISLRGAFIYQDPWIMQICQLNCPDLSIVLLDYIGENYLQRLSKIWLNKTNWLTIYKTQGHNFKRKVKQRKKQKSKSKSNR